MRAMTLVGVVASVALIVACGKKDQPETPAAPPAEQVEAAEAPDKAEGEPGTADAPAGEGAEGAEEAVAEAKPAAEGGALATDGDAMKRALEMQRRAMQILSDNKANPEAAAAAINAFHKDNEAAIEGLKKDLQQMQTEFENDPAAAMKFMEQYSEELQAVMTLSMSLMQEAPDLMASPAVAMAMAKLSPEPGGAGHGHDHDHDHHGHDHHGHDHHGHDHDHDHAHAAPSNPLNEAEMAQVGKALDHQEKVLEILEKSGGDAANAVEALTQYMTDNKAELEQLAAIQQRIGEDEALMMQVMSAHMERIGKLGERMGSLFENHAELLMNADVSAAMAKIMGGDGDDDDDDDDDSDE